MFAYSTIPTAPHFARPIRTFHGVFRLATWCAFFGFAATGLSARIAFAQQPISRPPKPDTAMAKMTGMTGARSAEDTSMTMAMMPGPLGIPMTRMGSGTSWLPDASPMHAQHMMAGPWELMLHGVAFAMYDRQNGPRGSEQFSSVNWGMLMASRLVAGGKLSLRGMMSLEPFTLGGNGYPLVLQSGEEFQGQPLHDRQHPHDLFMEVAGLYERSITPGLGYSLYVAPVGEPASGPVAFPHRPSAMNDPLAPIGHHWQDATHISFGVLTAGLYTRSVKIEGSLFNGREPDENRTNFDYRGRSLDSYAGRVTWNPSGQWSLSGSYAYLKSPEGAHPNESLHRMSASVLNNRMFGATGDWSTALIFGANQVSSEKALKASYLAETNLEFGNGHTVFGRAENVEKSADDLVLGPNPPARTFKVSAVALGYLYEFDRQGTIRTGLGVRASVNFVPASLATVYGSRQPTGFAIYVRFRPAPMAGHQAGTASGHSMGHGVDAHAGAPPPNRLHDLERARDVRAARDSSNAMPGMAMPRTPPDSMSGMRMPKTAHDSMAGMRVPTTAGDTSARIPATMPDMKSMLGMDMKPASDSAKKKTAPPASGKTRKTPAKPTKKPTPAKAAPMPGMSMPGMKMPADTIKKPPVKMP